MENTIKYPYWQRIISLLVLVCFFITSINIPFVRAQEFPLPTPGVMVHLSPEFNPPILKGLKVHIDNPFRFDFILDKGDSQLSDQAVKNESSRLIKYFLASLTIPEKDLWVNLSPYEKERIIPSSFGLTEMGRDLLAEDYMLKQITASLIYPEDELGKKFWKRVYEEAQKKLGKTDIPVNSFNKVWIVPEKAVVYENAQAATAYVVESKLKVMLEEDYLALSQQDTKEIIASGSNKLGSQQTKQIVQEIIIPQLTKEVNEGKNFAKLRQVYQSLILATWYKKKIKDSILAKVYSNQNKVAGVNIDDPTATEKIYQQYLQAFKKGVYNYIKEDIDPTTQKIVPRKYFSGGFTAKRLFDADGAMTVITQLPKGLNQANENLSVISGAIKPISVRPPESTSLGLELPQEDYGNLVSKDDVLFKDTVLHAQISYYKVKNSELNIFKTHKNLAAFYSYSPTKKAWVILLNKNVPESILKEAIDHELFEISVSEVMKKKDEGITEQEAHMVASFYQRKQHSKQEVSYQLTDFDKWQIANMSADEILKLINESRQWHIDQTMALLIDHFQNGELEDTNNIMGIYGFLEAYTDRFKEALESRYKELTEGGNSGLSIKGQFPSYHQGRISRVIISPNGKFLATGGEDGNVYILDSTNGHVLKRLEEGFGEITSLDFDPNNEKLAFGDNEGNVVVWDFANQKEPVAVVGKDYRRVSLGKSIEWLRFKILENVGLSLNICIKGIEEGYSVDTMTATSTSGSETGDNIFYRGFDFHKAFVNVIASGEFRSFSDTQSKHLDWQGHDGGIKTVVWASDNKRFLSVGKTDKKIKLWFKDEATLLQEFNNPEGDVLTVAFFNEDKYVASSDTSGRVVLWETDTGKQVDELQLDRPVHSLAVTPEGKLIAVGESKQIAVIDIILPTDVKPSVPQNVTSLISPHGTAITQTKVSPNGKFLATGGEDGKVYILDSTNGHVLKRLEEGFGEITSLDFDPDNEKLAFGDNEGNVVVWDFANQNEPVAVVGKDYRGTTLGKPIEWLRFRTWKNRDKTQLDLHVAVNHSNYTFLVKNMTIVSKASSLQVDSSYIKYNGFDESEAFVKAYSTGEFSSFSHPKNKHLDWQGHDGGIKTVVWASDNKRFLSVGKTDKKIKLWFKDEATLLQEFNNPEGDVLTVAFFNEDKYFATGDTAGRVVFWETATGKKRGSPIQLKGVIRSLAVTPDGRLIAVGDSHQISVIDINLTVTESQDLVANSEEVDVKPAVKEEGASPAVRIITQGNISKSLLEIHPVTTRTHIMDYQIPELSKAPPSNPRLIDLWRKFRDFERVNFDVLALLNKSSKTVSDVHRLLNRMQTMVQIYEHLFKGQPLDRPLPDIAADPNHLQGGKAIAQVFLLLKERIEQSLKALSSTTSIPEALDQELNRYDKGAPGKTDGLIVKRAEEYSPDEINNISIAELVNIVHQKGNRNFSAWTGQIGVVPQEAKVFIAESSGKETKRETVSVAYFDARSKPTITVPTPVRLMALGLTKGHFIHGHYRDFILGKGNTTVNMVADERLATMNMKLGAHSCLIQFSPMPISEGGRVVVQYTDSGEKYEPGSSIRVKALAQAFQGVGFKVRPEGYSFEAIFDKDTGARSIDELPQKLHFALQALISTRDLDLEIKNGSLKDQRNRSIQFLANQLIRNGYIWRGEGSVQSDDSAMASKSDESNTDDWKRLAEFLRYPVPAGHIGQLFMDGLLKRYKVLVNRGAVLNTNGQLRWDPAYEGALKKSPVSNTLQYLEKLDSRGLVEFRQMGLVAQTIEPFILERQVVAAIGAYTLEKMVLPTLEDALTFYAFKNEKGDIAGAWVVQGECFYKDNQLSLAAVEQILTAQNMEMSQKVREYLSQLIGDEFTNIFEFLRSESGKKYFSLPFGVEEFLKPAKLHNQISPLSIGGKMTNAGFSLATVKFRREESIDQNPENFKNRILIAPMTDARDDPQMKQSAGIVVTTGGELSHAAIRAREFGKPSIILNGATIEAAGILHFGSFIGEEKQQEHQFQGKTLKVFERSNYEQITVSVKEGDLVALDAAKGMFYVVAQSHDQPAIMIYDKYLQWKNDQSSKDQPDTKELEQAILSQVNNEALLKAILTDLVESRRLKPEVFETMVADYLAKHPEKKEMLLGFILQLAQDAIQSFNESKQLFDQVITQNNPESILMRVAEFSKQIQAVRQLMAVANGQWVLEMTPDQLTAIHKDMLKKSRAWLANYRKNLKPTDARIKEWGTKSLSFLVRKENELSLVGMSFEEDAPVVLKQMNRLKQERENQIQELAQRPTLSKEEIKDRWGRILVGGKSGHSAEIGSAVEILEKSGIEIGLKVRIAEGFAVTKTEYDRWIQLGKPIDSKKAISFELQGMLLKDYKDIVRKQLKRIDDLLDSDERTSPTVKIEIQQHLADLEHLGTIDNVKLLDTYINMTRKLLKPYLTRTDGSISRSLQKRLAVLGVVVARSSGIEEDSLQQSGAGTKTTVLGVISCSELFDAIVKVWASGAEAVLVEEMINAKKSVVAFSADPIGKRVDDVRIEAAEGLAKGLVDHLVQDPDVYVVDSNDVIRDPIHIGNKQEQVVLDVESPDQVKVQKISSSHSQILNEKEIKGVSILVRNLAKYFGFFGDMEASFDADGELVVLQIRPITTLTHAIHEGLKILDGTNDQAMVVNNPANTGGIDLTPANMNLQTQNSGGEIKFKLDSVVLKQLQNAPGFVPVIMSVNPLKDLYAFLGTNVSKTPEAVALK